MKREEFRRRTRKVTTFFMVLILVFAWAFSACAFPDGASSTASEGTGDTAVSSSESEAASETEPEDLRRRVVIVRPQYELSSVNTEQVRKVEKKINEALLKRGADIAVELLEVYHLDYPNYMKNALAAGTAGIAFADTRSAEISVRALADSGLAADLSELLPGSKVFSLMPEQLFQLSAVNGRSYAVPVYDNAALSYDLLVSKDFAEGYGLDPYTLGVEEMSVYDMMKALSPYLEDARNVDTVCPLFLGREMVEAAFHSRIEFFDTEGAALFGIDRETLSAADLIRDKEYAKLLSLTAKYRELGYIDADFTRMPDGKERTYAFALTESAPGAESLYPEAAVLRLSSGLYMQESVLPRGAYVVSAAATEEQQKDCLEFLGYLYSVKEIADLFTYGILGEDFTVGENGKLHLTADRNYAHSPWESTSVIPLTPLISDPDYYAEDCEERNRNAELSPAAGFRFDPAPVQEEYDACMRVYRNRGLFLERGSYGSKEVKKTLKTYISEMEEAGYNTVRAEIDRQIVSWIRSRKH